METAVPDPIPYEVFQPGIKGFTVEPVQGYRVKCERCPMWSEAVVQPDAFHKMFMAVAEHYDKAHREEDGVHADDARADGG